MQPTEGPASIKSERPPRTEPDAGPSSSTIDLAPFDFQPLTRVVFGCGVLDRLGEYARTIGLRHALLVTDPGIRQAGHVERACHSLDQAGIRWRIFDGVEENPTTRHVAAGVEVARKAGIDSIVGLGGGSSLDAAKGINFILTNGGRMQDYWGVGKAKKPMLPLIGVPTTAGTGSEAQSFALIADEETHQKMACGDKKAACRLAMLDPEVTISQPAGVTAAVGIDAISHAIESYVTTKRNAVSTMFAREAWRLLKSGFRRVLESPGDLDARGQMLLGAHFAGAAIEQSMLGATHAAANPLTANFGITHGIAIGVMLPYVIRFNAPAVEDLYRDLADQETDSAAAGLARWISKSTRLAGYPHSLRELDVPETCLDELAEEAAAQWTAGFNPRPITAADFLDLYRRAHAGEH